MQNGQARDDDRCCDQSHKRPNKIGSGEALNHQLSGDGWPPTILQYAEVYRKH